MDVIGPAAVGVVALLLLSYHIYLLVRGDVQ